MRPKTGDMWTLRRLPARLNCAEVSALLGFTEDDIRYLATKKLLPSLAGASLCTFWFASVEVETLSRDTNWLARATKAIRAHNKARNERQSRKLSSENPAT